MSDLPRLNAVSVDCETLGTRAGCVVLSVAAVAFNDDGGTIIDEEGLLVVPHAFRVVPLDISLRAGLRIEPETLAWWTNQDAGLLRDMVKVLKDSPGIIGPPSAVFDRLKNWSSSFDFEAPDLMRWWAHGATFDFPVLEAAMAAIEPLGFGSGKPPWHYRSTRDTRTLFEIAGNPKAPEPRFVSRATESHSDKRFFDSSSGHHPIYDAVKQAIWIQQARAKIRDRMGLVQNSGW